MKFRFRLETVMRQRRAERDAAQRVYAEAQAKLQAQLSLIQQMYSELDNAREMSDQKVALPGAKSTDLVQIADFVEGQKVRIRLAREKARELMAVAEEKHEILIEASQAFRILEKLKEKKREEFKIQYNKKQAKEQDDITIMRMAHRGAK